MAAAMSDVTTLARAALAGAATGGRTFSGLAALAVRTPAGASVQPDVTLARRGVRTAIGVAAASELIADKLPTTPSRWQPPGLVGRLIGSATSGVIISRRAGGTDALAMGTCAGLGVAAALGGAWLGVRWRQAGTARIGSAFAAAAVEDVVVAALAYAASRPA